MQGKIGKSEQRNLASEIYSRPLAEHLAPEISLSALRNHMTHRTPAGHFHSAWNHVEVSLNKSVEIEDDLRVLYIDDANALCGMVLNQQRATEDMRLAALTLSTYSPCMRKRALGESITPEDCSEVYSGLGAAIQYLQPLRPGDPPRWRMAETAVLAVSARMHNPELLLYPTSPREESSPTSAENHDSYFLNGEQKLPIQQKLIPTERTYNDNITLMNLQPMMEKTYRKCGMLPPHTSADQLNHLLSLIVAETTDEQALSRHEREYLNRISGIVAYHHFEAYQRQIVA